MFYIQYILSRFVIGDIFLQLKSTEKMFFLLFFELFTISIQSSGTKMLGLTPLSLWVGYVSLSYNSALPKFQNTVIDVTANQ